MDNRLTQIFQAAKEKRASDRNLKRSGKDLIRSKDILQSTNQEARDKVAEYLESKLAKLKKANLKKDVKQVDKVASVNDTTSEAYLLNLLNQFYPNPSVSASIKKSYKAIQKLINEDFIYRFSSSLVVPKKITEASQFYASVTYLCNSIKRTFVQVGVDISEMDENQILNEIYKLETLDRPAMLPEIKARIDEIRSSTPPPSVL